MQKQIFEYDSYKDFILNWIESTPNNGRGQRRKIAESVGCQVAYVSHVLAADRDFSIEQTEALGRYMKLSPNEQDYFINLVEFERAGTHQLKSHYKKQLDQKRLAFHEIQNRVSHKDKINPVDQSMYYSSWQFQAIRIAITSPDFRTAQKISDALSIPIERVLEVLEFFQEKGLAEKKGDEYFSIPKSLHLSSDSPLINKMHGNWRLKTLNKLDQRKADNLHYSACVTLGKSDYLKIREILLNAVLTATDEIKKSGTDSVCALTVDFYELG